MDYVKVLLYAYPKLDKFAEASDRAVENKAALSFLRREDTLSVAEEIVEEIAFARLLRQINAAIGEMVAHCTLQEQLLLEYKYFRRKKKLSVFAAVQLCCSERNYFRKQNALLKKMYELFLRRGYTEEWFFARFRRSSAFMHAYKMVRAGKDRTASKRGYQNSFSHSSERVQAGFLPRMTKTTIATADTPSAQRKKTVVPSTPSDATSFEEELPPTGSCVR